MIYKISWILASALVVSVAAQQPQLEFNSHQLKVQAAEATSGAMVVPNLQPKDLAGYEKKSVGLAMLYSLILPGMGEAYVGETGYTKVFLSLEAVGWGLLIANNLDVSWRTDEYQAFAVQHAGVNKSGKDDDYWINIGKHDSMADYNEQRRRDRNVQAIYKENEFNNWQWDSRSNRLGYDWLRIRARQIAQQEIYYIGGLVLNHVVSAINAVRLARSYNKKAELSWQLESGFDWRSGKIRVGLAARF